ncbi:SDR family NAD(P)-dependent oxidoreductase [Nitratireductor indicus]|uniref:3-oxoacyl-ACP reductase n=1 Tax=Nitratireductor indicus C115 TaxID=1231190 RepID=K2NSG9_9HYPH|nr:SDR family NAD(P)-dependent oxidoreductase [Nitratireductor indicus]EKF40719.1 3-oxoacyl-ACP reductase [Nitratireductor indicus C115]MDS1136450.1 SDR family NAD(P)-dependent oxidoreductase [Nitratireductor indicus]SFQ76083.1 NAD(P)-dependent dehydrogenase, short-chain alcohol dehydrogenase family [Nitratireductor indicus]
MKSVAITGGASGIGLASAKLLLARGFAPWLLDLKPQMLADACIELGLPTERGIVCNVADEASVAEAIGKVAQAGQFVGVVNSAGIAVDRPAVETSVEDFRRILDVNLTGSFIVSRAAARIWLERGVAGSIVNISSISGMRGNKGRSAYGASKGGVNTMTMVMANELGPNGIRVNAIAPGPIDTPLARAVHTEDVRAQWQKRVPLRRYGTTEEIAGAVAFLMSEDGGYVNGQVIAVDGGFITAGLSA